MTDMSTHDQHHHDHHAHGVVAKPNVDAAHDCCTTAAPKPEATTHSCCHGSDRTTIARSAVIVGRCTGAMHPEVVGDQRGSCPKCGMALEPMIEALAPQAAEWTCPMHPEVVSDKPGNCPKCGMALEPKMPSLDHA